MRPFVLAFAFLVVAPSAVAARPRLTPPVPGTIVRGFAYGADPFARGLHRGIDLAAADGAPVRAACSGRVTFAGRAGANGRTVTIRCGAWSVTQLPLASLAVRAGEHIAAGAALGEAGAAAGHEGLHLGVRRAHDRFGYVDPAPLLHTPAPHAPPAAPIRTTLRHRPPPPLPAPLPSRLRHTSPPRPPAPLPSRVRPGSSPVRTPRALAPWPAWAGLALLLCGALGAGTSRAVRRSRAPLAGALAREVR